MDLPWFASPDQDPRTHYTVISLGTLTENTSLSNVLSVSMVWLMVMGSSMSSSSHPPAVTAAARPKAACVLLPAASGPDKRPLRVRPVKGKA
jgi:hypothetical protein